MRPRLFKTLTIALLAASLASACDDGIPEGCDHFVEPGGDDQTAIQTAFVSAANGETVCLGAGTFVLTDPLEVRGLTGFTFRGAGMMDTTLDFSGQETGGAGVDMNVMTNVLVEEMSIIDATGNGLRIQDSDGVVVRRVNAGWTAEDDPTNGKYAIYPVRSMNVLVENSIAYNTSDAGFYMGQTENCIMRNNEAYGNVAAYEVENSLNCEVYGNEARDNTGGFLVFELPNLPMRGGGTAIHDNMSISNNRPNFGDPSTTVGMVPRGSGVFILAAHDVEVFNNTIEGNEGAAFTVVSYPTVSAVSGEPPPDDPGFDLFTSGVWLHDNTFSGNGTNPGGLRADGETADTLEILINLINASSMLMLDTFEDTSWDGFLDMGDTPADILCMSDNGMPSYRNFDVGGLGGAGHMTTTDPSPHDCTGTARAPVDDSFAAFATPGE